MKHIITLFFILFAFNVSAQNVFNPVIIDEYKALDSQSAIEYLMRKLNPKFPKDTQVKIDDITLSGEHFKMISFYAFFICVNGIRFHFICSIKQIINAGMIKICQSTK